MMLILINLHATYEINMLFRAKKCNVGKFCRNRLIFYYKTILCMILSIRFEFKSKFAA